jgi:hypothetical protein
LNLTLYRWGRALDLAVKYRSHVDTVLGYRLRHLEEFGKTEKNAKFLQYSGQVSEEICDCFHFNFPILFFIFPTFGSSTSSTLLNLIVEMNNDSHPLHIYRTEVTNYVQ